MKKGVVFVDAEKCLACRSCELACAVAHSGSGSLSEAIRETPLPRPRVGVEGIGDISIPLQCRHCEDAPCARVCPTGAIEKSGGGAPVAVREELCIGCKFCVLVCPFGVIGIGHRGRAAVKCDLCAERLKEGKEPACVGACPTKALRFVPPEELARDRRMKVADELLRQVSEEAEKHSGGTK